MKWIIYINWSLILLLVCILSTPVLGQQEREDSLVSLLATDISDSLKFQIYYEVIWANSRRNTQKALELNDGLLKLANSANNENWLIFSHYYYGVLYKNAGEWQKSISYLDTVYQKAETARDTNFMANSAYQLGSVYSSLSNYDRAMFYLNKNIELNVHLKNLGRVANTQNTKASLYRRMGLYDPALEQYGQALDYFISIQDSSGMANVYSNLGNSYSELDSLEKAMEYYNRQEAINFAQKNRWGLGYSHDNKGKLLQKMGRTNEAIAQLEQSVKIRRAMEHKALLSESLVSLSSSLLANNQLNLAKKCTIEAIELAQEFRMNSELQNGYQMLSNIESRLGNYERAYQNVIKYNQIKDSILNATISEQTLKIDALTNIDNISREQKIQLLMAQNEVNDLKLISTRKNLIVLMMGAIGLTAFTFLIYRNGRKSKILNRKLEDQNEVILSSLNDKKYLLKEIHHRVKNNLQVISSLLKLQSKTVGDSKAQIALNEGRNRIRSMALIHQNLYQEDDTKGGIRIKDYLTQLAGELLESYKIVPTNISVQLEVDDLFLDVDSVVPIGLIINELMSNSLKYAFNDQEEGEVVISLSKNEHSNLELIVKDNGIGYDINEVSTGSFGLRLIRAFAERLQADHKFSSNNGSRAEFVIRDYMEITN